METSEIFSRHDFISYQLKWSRKINRYNVHVSRNKLTDMSCNMTMVRFFSRVTAVSTTAPGVPKKYV